MGVNQVLYIKLGKTRNLSYSLIRAPINCSKRLDM